MEDPPAKVMVGGEIIPKQPQKSTKAALTAYAGPIGRRRALLAGFQTHLPKPVEPDDLLAVILSLTFQPPTGNGRESC
jgi:CheY-like chemotaxis protein